MISICWQRLFCKQHINRAWTSMLCIDDYLHTRWCCILTVSHWQLIKIMESWERVIDRRSASWQYKDEFAADPDVWFLEICRNTALSIKPFQPCRQHGTCVYSKQRPEKRTIGHNQVCWCDILPTHLLTVQSWHQWQWLLRSSIRCPTRD